MSTLLRQLFYRYKLLHLLLLLLLSLLLLFLYDDPKMPFWPQWMAWLIAVACCAMAAKIVVKWLLPLLLQQKRIRAFLIYTALIALANSVFTYILAGGIYVLLTGDGPLFSDIPFFIYLVGFFYLANAVVIGVACLLRFTTDRARLEVRLSQIEQEKKSAELSYLRAQTNPHFLFNVLNNIYFQIDAENEAARASVEKLAGILRYQLYECNAEKIGIERELKNIRNYMDIQKMRLEAGTDVRMEVEPGLKTFQLAPLLILPLIENAFKHLSHDKIAENNHLLIRLFHQEEGIFVVEISNTIQEPSLKEKEVPQGGVGLPNLRRRLTLLYPDRHQLETHCDGSVYRVKLQIAYDDSMFTGRRRTHSEEGLAGIY